MKLLLLCAGEGTRLRPHTLKRPKPAIPFLGIPLACYSLSWASELKISSLVVNTYHLPEKIHELFQKIPHGISQIDFSDEFPKLMGSGGGIAKASAFLKSSNEFLVMNGDEVFLPSEEGFLVSALETHQKQNRLATLFVMDHPEVGVKFGGVWTDSENRILGFGKNPIPGAVKAWHFIGSALYSNRLLKRLDPEVASNILYDDLTQAIKDQESLFVEPVTGWWQETGNEADYFEATRDCLKILFRHEKESKLLHYALRHFAGAWALRGEKEDQLSLVFETSDVSVDTQLLGWNVVGPEVTLRGENSLENTVVASHGEAIGLHAKNQLILD